MDETSKPEVGIIKRGRVKRLFKPVRNKLIFGAGLILTGACVALFLILQKNDNTTPKDSEGPAYTVSDKDWATRLAKSLQKSPPSKDAPVEEKKVYYQELIANQHIASDYEGAVKSYEEATAILGQEGLPYNAYLAAARSYTKLGSKDKAAAVLTNAEQMIKKGTSDQGLLDEFLNGITEARKELDI